MSWSRRARVVVVGGLALSSIVVLAPPADAAPVARFTASRLFARTGVVVTFDASRSRCDVAPCRYLWRWYRPATATSVDRTGVGMGEGPLLTYAWTTPGEKIVVLKVVDATTTHSSSTRQRIITVR